VSVNVCFVCEGQITQPLTVTFEQAGTQRSVSLCLFFRHELENGDCDAVLPVDGKERLGSYDEVCVNRQFFPKTIPLDNSSV
jgi:hypothetical protein